MSGFSPATWPRRLRSQEWFEGTSKDNIYHRSWMKNQGLPADLFDGRPVIGICNTWSQLTPCNAHLRDLAERVQPRRLRGRRPAGRVPGLLARRERAPADGDALPQPLRPWTSRRRCAANPIDGVVLLAGCDKTTPALLMGAASVDIPAILVSGGPMLNGWFRGERVGSGTALWQMSEAVKAGTMTQGGLPRRRGGDEPLARLVQHHGHRLDDGEHGRGAGHGALAATPRSRRSTRGAG